MRHLASVIGAVIGVGLYPPQAMAADNGDFSLEPGEAKQDTFRLSITSSLSYSRR